MVMLNGRWRDWDSSKKQKKVAIYLILFLQATNKKMMYQLTRGAISSGLSMDAAEGEQPLPCSNRIAFSNSRTLFSNSWTYLL